MTIRRLLAFTATLATTCAVSDATAQDPGLDLQGLSGFAVLDGTCQRFIVAGKDLTNECDGTVVNTMYERTGRTGFAFVTRSNTSVTFSGGDTPAEGDQAHSVVDRVFFSIENTESDPQAVKSDVLQATGTCTYTNPYAGPSRINCSASTKDGPFIASFLSDGNPPKIERL